MIRPDGIEVVAGYVSPEAGLSGTHHLAVKLRMMEVEPITWVTIRPEAGGPILAGQPHHRPKWIEVNVTANATTAYRIRTACGASGYLALISFRNGGKVTCEGCEAAP